MNKFSRFVLVACGGFAAVAARAQVLTYAVAIPQALTSWSKAVELPSFNPGVGTLTGVKLSLTGDLAQTLNAENLDPSHLASYDVQSSALFTAGLQGGPIAVSLPMNMHSTGMLGLWDEALDFAGASGYTGVQLDNSADSALRGDLSPYVGVTPLQFFAGVALGGTTWRVDNSGASLVGARTTAGAALQIEYSYLTAIPEPAGSAALCATIVFLAAVYRRRRLLRTNLTR